MRSERIAKFREVVDQVVGGEVRTEVKFLLDLAGQRDELLEEIQVALNHLSFIDDPDEGSVFDKRVLAVAHILQAAIQKARKHDE